MILFLVVVFIASAVAFHIPGHFTRFGRPALSNSDRILSERHVMPWSKIHAKPNSEDVTAAPYGTKFLAAEIGVPAATEEYGGGDVGGNDYKDALFQCGVRKNVPPITEDAVVKVPNMRYVERGYSEAKAAVAFAAEKFKTGEWSKSEDIKLIELVGMEKEGVRGRWVRISQALRRSTQDCSLRWYQVLNPSK
jgi:hypothetical protein